MITFDRCVKYFICKLGGIKFQSSRIEISRKFVWFVLFPSIITRSFEKIQIKKETSLGREATGLVSVHNFSKIRIFDYPKMHKSLINMYYHKGKANFSLECPKYHINPDLRDYFYPLECPGCGITDADEPVFCEICGFRRRFQAE